MFYVVVSSSKNWMIVVTTKHRRGRYRRFMHEYKPQTSVSK